MRRTLTPYGEAVASIAALMLFGLVAYAVMR